MERGVPNTPGSGCDKQDSNEGANPQNPGSASDRTTSFHDTKASHQQSGSEQQIQALSGARPISSSISEVSPAEPTLPDYGLETERQVLRGEGATSVSSSSPSPHHTGPMPIECRSQEVESVICYPEAIRLEEKVPPLTVNLDGKAKEQNVQPLTCDRGIRAGDSSSICVSHNEGNRTITEDTTVNRADTEENTTNWANSGETTNSVNVTKSSGAEKPNLPLDCKAKTAGLAEIDDNTLCSAQGTDTETTFPTANDSHETVSADDSADSAVENTSDTHHVAAEAAKSSLIDRDAGEPSVEVCVIPKTGLNETPGASDVLNKEDREARSTVHNLSSGGEETDTAQQIRDTGIEEAVSICDSQNIGVQVSDNEDTPRICEKQSINMEEAPNVFETYDSYAKNMPVSCGENDSNIKASPPQDNKASVDTASTLSKTLAVKKIARDYSSVKDDSIDSLAETHTLEDNTHDLNENIAKNNEASKMDIKLILQALDLRFEEIQLPINLIPVLDDVIYDIADNPAIEPPSPPLTRQCSVEKSDFKVIGQGNLHENEPERLSVIRSSTPITDDPLSEFDNNTFPTYEEIEREVESAKADADSENRKATVAVPDRDCSLSHNEEHSTSLVRFNLYQGSYSDKEGQHSTHVSLRRETSGPHTPKKNQDKNSSLFSPSYSPKWEEETSQFEKETKSMPRFLEKVGRLLVPQETINEQERESKILELRQQHVPPREQGNVSQKPSDKSFESEGFSTPPRRYELTQQDSLLSESSSESFSPRDVEERLMAYREARIRAAQYQQDIQAIETSEALVPETPVILKISQSNEDSAVPISGDLSLRENSTISSPERGALSLPVEQANATPEKQVVRNWFPNPLGIVLQQGQESAFSLPPPHTATVASVSGLHPAEDSALKHREDNSLAAASFSTENIAVKQNVNSGITDKEVSVLSESDCTTTKSHYLTTESENYASVSEETTVSSQHEDRTFPTSKTVSKEGEAEDSEGKANNLQQTDDSVLLHTESKVIKQPSSSLDVLLDKRDIDQHERNVDPLPSRGLALSQTQTESRMLQRKQMVAIHKEQDTLFEVEGACALSPREAIASSKETETFYDQAKILPTKDIDSHSGENFYLQEEVNTQQKDVVASKKKVSISPKQANNAPKQHEKSQTPADDSHNRQVRTLLREEVVSFKPKVTSPTKQIKPTRHVKVSPQKLGGLERHIRTSQQEIRRLALERKKSPHQETIGTEKQLASLPSRADCSRQVKISPQKRNSPKKVLTSPNSLADSLQRQGVSPQKQIDNSESQTSPQKQKHSARKVESTYKTSSLQRNVVSPKTQSGCGQSKASPQKVETGSRQKERAPPFKASGSLRHVDSPPKRTTGSPQKQVSPQSKESFLSRQTITSPQKIPAKHTQEVGKLKVIEKTKLTPSRKNVQTDSIKLPQAKVTASFHKEVSSAPEKIVSRANLAPRESQRENSSLSDRPSELLKARRTLPEKEVDHIPKERQPNQNLAFQEEGGAITELEKCTCLEIEPEEEFNRQQRKKAILVQNEHAGLFQDKDAVDKRDNSLPAREESFKVKELSFSPQIGVSEEHLYEEDIVQNNLAPDRKRHSSSQTENEEIPLTQSTQLPKKDMLLKMAKSSSTQTENTMLNEEAKHQKEKSVSTDRGIATHRLKRNVLKRERSDSWSKDASHKNVRFLKRRLSMSPPSLQRQTMRLRRTKSLTSSKRMGTARENSRGVDRKGFITQPRRAINSQTVRGLQREQNALSNSQAGSLLTNENDVSQESSSVERNRLKILRRTKSCSPQALMSSKRSLGSPESSSAQTEESYVQEKNNVPRNTITSSKHSNLASQSKVRILYSSPDKDKSVCCKRKEEISLPKKSVAPQRKYNIYVRKAYLKSPAKQKTPLQEDFSKEASHCEEKSCGKSLSGRPMTSPDERIALSKTKSVTFEYREENTPQIQPADSQNEDMQAVVDVDTFPMPSKNHAELKTRNDEQNSSVYDLTSTVDGKSTLSLSIETKEKLEEKKANELKQEMIKRNGKVSETLKFSSVSTSNDLRSVDKTQTKATTNKDECQKEANEGFNKKDVLTTGEQEQAEHCSKQTVYQEGNVKNSPVGEKSDGVKRSTTGESEQAIQNRCQDERKADSKVNVTLSLSFIPPQIRPQDVQSCPEFLTTRTRSAVIPERENALGVGPVVEFRGQHNTIYYFPAHHLRVTQAIETFKAEEKELLAQESSGLLSGKSQDTPTCRELPETPRSTNQTFKACSNTTGSLKELPCDSSIVFQDAEEYNRPEAIRGQREENSNTSEAVANNQSLKTATDSPEHDPENDQQGKSKKKKKKKKKSKSQTDNERIVESASFSCADGQATEIDLKEEMSRQLDEEMVLVENEFESYEAGEEKELDAMKSDFIFNEVAMRVENEKLKMEMEKMRSCQNTPEGKRQMLREKLLLRKKLDAVQKLNSIKSVATNPKNENESNKTGPTHAEKIEWFDDQIRKSKPSSDAEGIVKKSLNDEEIVKIQREIQRLRERDKKQNEAGALTRTIMPKKKSDGKPEDNLPPCVHRRPPSAGTYLSKGRAGNTQKKDKKKTSSSTTNKEDDLEEVLRQFREEQKECGVCEICINLQEHRLARQACEIVRSKNLTDSELDEVVQALEEERKRELAREKLNLYEQNSQKKDMAHRRKEEEEGKVFNIPLQQRAAYDEKMSMILLEEQIEEERERRLLEKEINERVKAEMRKVKKQFAAAGENTTTKKSSNGLDKMDTQISPGTAGKTTVATKEDGTVFKSSTDANTCQANLEKLCEASQKTNKRKKKSSSVTGNSQQAAENFKSTVKDTDIDLSQKHIKENTKPMCVQETNNNEAMSKITQSSTVSGSDKGVKPSEEAIKAVIELINRETEPASRYYTNSNTNLIPIDCSAQDAVKHPSNSEQTLNERKKTVSEVMGVEEVVVFGEREFGIGRGKTISISSNRPKHISDIIKEASDMSKLDQLNEKQTSTQPLVQNDNNLKPSCQRDLSFKNLIGAPYFHGGKTPQHPIEAHQKENPLPQSAQINQTQDQQTNRNSITTAAQSSRTEEKIPVVRKEPEDAVEVNEVEATEKKPRNASVLAKSSKMKDDTGTMTTVRQEVIHSENQISTNDTAPVNHKQTTASPQLGAENTDTKTDSDGMENLLKSTTSGNFILEQIPTTPLSNQGNPRQDPVFSKPVPETGFANHAGDSSRFFQVYKPTEEERDINDSSINLFEVPYDWLNSPSDVIQSRLFLVKVRGYRFTHIKGYPVFRSSSYGKDLDAEARHFADIIKRKRQEVRRQPTATNLKSGHSNKKVSVKNKDETNKCKEMPSNMKNTISDENVDSITSCVTSTDPLPTSNPSDLGGKDRLRVSQVQGTNKAEVQQYQELQSNVISTTTIETHEDRRGQLKGREVRENRISTARQPLSPIKEVTEPGEMVSSDTEVLATPLDGESSVLPGMSEEIKISPPQRQAVKPSNRKQKSRRQKRYKMANLENSAPEPAPSSKKNKKPEKKSCSQGVIEVSLEKIPSESPLEEKDIITKDSNTDEIHRDDSDQGTSDKTESQKAGDIRKKGEEIKNLSAQRLEQHNHANNETITKDTVLENKDELYKGSKIQLSGEESKVEKTQITQKESLIIEVSIPVQKSSESISPGAPIKEPANQQPKDTNDFDEESESCEKPEDDKRDKKIKKMSRRQIKRQKRIMKAQAAAYFREEKIKLEHEKQKKIQDAQPGNKTFENDYNLEAQSLANDAKEIASRDLHSNDQEEQAAKQSVNVEVKIKSGKSENIIFSPENLNENKSGEQEPKDNKSKDYRRSAQKASEDLIPNNSMQDRSSSPHAKMTSKDGAFKPETFFKDAIITDKIAHRSAVLLSMIQDFSNILRELQVASDMHPRLVYTMLTSHLTADYKGKIQGYNTGKVAPPANPVGKHDRAWLEGREVLEPINGKTDRHGKGIDKSRVSRVARVFGLIRKDEDDISWWSDNKEKDSDDSDDNELSPKSDDKNDDDDDDGDGYNGGASGGNGGGFSGGRGGGGDGRRESDGESDVRSDSGTESDGGAKGQIYDDNENDRKGKMAETVHEESRGSETDVSQAKKSYDHTKLEDSSSMPKVSVHGNIIKDTQGSSGLNPKAGHPQTDSLLSLNIAEFPKNINQENKHSPERGASQEADTVVKRIDAENSTLKQRSDAQVESNMSLFVKTSDESCVCDASKSKETCCPHKNYTESCEGATITSLAGIVNCEVSSVQKKSQISKDSQSSSHKDCAIIEVPGRTKIGDSQRNMQNKESFYSKNQKQTCQTKSEYINQQENDSNHFDEKVYRNKVDNLEKHCDKKQNLKLEKNNQQNESQKSKTKQQNSCLSSPANEMTKQLSSQNCVVLSKTSSNELAISLVSTETEKREAQKIPLATTDTEKEVFNGTKKQQDDFKQVSTPTTLEKSSTRDIDRVHDLLGIEEAVDSYDSKKTETYLSDARDDTSGVKKALSDQGCENISAADGKTVRDNLTKDSKNSLEGNLKKKIKGIAQASKNGSCSAKEPKNISRNTKKTDDSSVTEVITKQVMETGPNSENDAKTETETKKSCLNSAKDSKNTKDAETIDFKSANNDPGTLDVVDFDSKFIKETKKSPDAKKTDSQLMTEVKPTKSTTDVKNNNSSSMQKAKSSSDFKKASQSMIKPKSTLNAQNLKSDPGEETKTTSDAKKLNTTLSKEIRNQLSTSNNKPNFAGESKNKASGSKVEDKNLPKIKLPSFESTFGKHRDVIYLTSKKDFPTTDSGKDNITIVDISDIVEIPGKGQKKREDLKKIRKQCQVAQPAPVFNNIKDSINAALDHFQTNFQAPNTFSVDEIRAAVNESEWMNKRPANSPIDGPVPNNQQQKGFEFLAEINSKIALIEQEELSTFLSENTSKSQGVKSKTSTAMEKGKSSGKVKDSSLAKINIRNDIDPKATVNDFARNIADIEEEQSSIIYANNVPKDAKATRDLAHEGKNNDDSAKYDTSSLEKHKPSDDKEAKHGFPDSREIDVINEPNGQGDINKIVNLNEIKKNLPKEHIIDQFNLESPKHKNDFQNHRSSEIPRKYVATSDAQTVNNWHDLPINRDITVKSSSPQKNATADIAAISISKTQPIALPPTTFPGTPGWPLSKNLAESIDAALGIYNINFQSVSPFSTEAIQSEVQGAALNLRGDKTCQSRDKKEQDLKEAELMSKIETKMAMLDQEFSKSFFSEDFENANDISFAKTGTETPENANENIITFEIKDAASGIGSDDSTDIQKECMSFHATDIDLGSVKAQACPRTTKPSEEVRTAKHCKSELKSFVFFSDGERMNYQLDNVKSTKDILINGDEANISTLSKDCKTYITYAIDKTTDDIPKDIKARKRTESIPLEPVKTCMWPESKNLSESINAVLDYYQMHFQPIAPLSTDAIRSAVKDPKPTTMEPEDTFDGGDTCKSKEKKDRGEEEAELLSELDIKITILDKEFNTSFFACEAEETKGISSKQADTENAAIVCILKNEDNNFGKSETLTLPSDTEPSEEISKTKGSEPELNLSVCFTDDERTNRELSCVKEKNDIPKDDRENGGRLNDNGARKGTLVIDKTTYHTAINITTENKATQITNATTGNDKAEKSVYMNDTLKIGLSKTFSEDHSILQLTQHSNDFESLGSPEIPRTYDETHNAQGTKSWREFPTSSQHGDNSLREIIVRTPSPSNTSTATSDIEHPSPVQSQLSSPDGCGNTLTFKPHVHIQPECQENAQDSFLSNPELFLPSLDICIPVSPSTSTSLLCLQSPSNFQTPEGASESSNNFFTPLESMSSKALFGTPSDVFHTPKASSACSIRSAPCEVPTGLSLPMSQDLTCSRTPCNYRKFSDNFQGEYSQGFTAASLLPLNSPCPLSPTALIRPGQDNRRSSTFPGVSAKSLCQFEPPSCLRHQNASLFSSCCCLSETSIEDTLFPSNELGCELSESCPEHRSNIQEIGNVQLWNVPEPDKPKRIISHMQKVVGIAIGVSPSHARIYTSVVNLHLKEIYDMCLHRAFPAHGYIETWLHPRVRHRMSKLLSSILSGSFKKCVYLVDGKQTIMKYEPENFVYSKPTDYIPYSDPIRKHLDTIRLEKAEELTIDLHHLSNSESFYGNLTVSLSLPVESFFKNTNFKTDDLEIESETPPLPCKQFRTHKGLVSSEGHVTVGSVVNIMSASSSHVQAKVEQVFSRDCLNSDITLQKHSTEAPPSTLRNSANAQTSESHNKFDELKPGEVIKATQPSKSHVEMPFSDIRLCLPNVFDIGMKLIAAATNDTRSPSELQKDAFINDMYIPLLMQKINKVLTRSYSFSSIMLLNEARHHYAVFNHLRPPTSYYERLDLGMCADLLQNLINLTLHSFYVRQVSEEQTNLSLHSVHSIKTTKAATKDGNHVDFPGEREFETYFQSFRIENQDHYLPHHDLVLNDLDGDVRFQGTQQNISANQSTYQLDQVFNNCSEIIPEVPRNHDGNYVGQSFKTSAVGSYQVSAPTTTTSSSSSDKNHNNLPSFENLHIDVTGLCRFRGLGCVRCNNTGFTPDGIPCNEAYDTDSYLSPSNGSMSSGHYSCPEDEDASVNQEAKADGQDTTDPKAQPVLCDDREACFNCFWLAGDRLKTCSSCHYAKYCSRACQREHFKNHRSICEHMATFHEAASRLPDYVKRLLELDKLKLTSLQWECPDVTEVEVKKFALLAQIASPCANTNGSGFGFHILDMIQNKVILLFYMGLHEVYYFPHEISEGKEGVPLYKLLTPGTFVLITRPVWCLFRNGHGFRVNDLRNMYIIFSKETVLQHQPQPKVKGGKRDKKKKKKAPKEEQQVRNPWARRNEAALTFWQEPNPFQLNRLGAQLPTEATRLPKEQDAALGLVHLKMESAGECNATKAVGGCVKAGAATGLKKDQNERSAASLGKDNVEVECRTEDGDAGASKGERGYEEAITGGFGFNEDKADTKSEGSTDTVSSGERNAQEAEEENQNTKTNAKGWKSKTEKKSKKGKKSKW